MLKLAKLPDRTPIKMSISVNAGLNQDLQRYAVLYQTTYGEEASVAELIPFMLDSFLKSDPAFAKARRESLSKTDGDKAATLARSPKPEKTASPNSHPTAQQKEI